MKSKKFEFIPLTPKVFTKLENINIVPIGLVINIPKSLENLLMELKIAEKQ